MKALKIIGILLLVVAVAFVIAMFVAPTDMNVAKSIEINAPKSVVQKYVTSFKLTNEWSPWMKMDPNAKNEYVGEDGQPGSIHKWEGNDSVGKGEQELISIGDDSIITQVRFLEPYESRADAYFVLEETAPNTTKVTWGFHSTMPRPFNVFGLFMNMEEMIGADYQKGLDSLKAVTERVALEATNQEYNGYKIEEVTFPETHFATLRDTLGWEELDKFYTGVPTIYSTLSQNGKQPGTVAGLFYTWDEANKSTDMAIGVAYTPAGDVASYSSVTLSGPALKLGYYGPYESSAQAHIAMDQYLKEKGLKTKSPVLEQYIVGPTTESDTSKWFTEIYYFVE